VSGLVFCEWIGGWREEGGSERRAPALYIITWASSRLRRGGVRIASMSLFVSPLFFFLNGVMDKSYDVLPTSRLTYRHLTRPRAQTGIRYPILTYPNHPILPILPIPYYLVLSFLSFLSFLSHTILYCPSYPSYPILSFLSFLSLPIPSYPSYPSLFLPILPILAMLAILAIPSHLIPEISRNANR